MLIFRTLMANRGLGWPPDAVRALNLIEIVFKNDKDVLEQCRKYKESLYFDKSDTLKLEKMKREQDKLLEIMAKSLDYDDTVTWDVIQNPYIPDGMAESIIKQKLFQDKQLELMNNAFELLNQKHN